MTAPTDRTALEEAIRSMEDWWQSGLKPGGPGPYPQPFDHADRKRIQLVCDAAAAWAETMPPALLPCPFCGAPGMGVFPSDHPEMDKWFEVICENEECFAVMSGMSAGEAVAAWNHRSHPESST